MKHQKEISKMEHRYLFELDLHHLTIINNFINTRVLLIQQKSLKKNTASIPMKTRTKDNHLQDKSNCQREK